MLATRLDELLDELEVSYHGSRKIVLACCPVHGGDNSSGLNIYREGHTTPGYWRCNTHRCHETFKSSLVGLVRGVLSHQKFGWTKIVPTDTVPFFEAVDWACNFLGTPFDEIKVNKSEIEKRKFATEVNNFILRSGSTSDITFTREQVRKYLQIPAQYFVSRGFSTEILDRYDVGYYPAKGKPLSGRAVVPVYDEQHKVVIGFSGRFVHEKCEMCSRWHEPKTPCPNKDEAGRTSKWYHQHFNKSGVLYNWWFAKAKIREAGKVLLVEGPVDVWRAVEAGCGNVVGLFGVELSDQQQVLLELSGAMEVCVALDNDQAGIKAAESIKERLRKAFKVRVLNYESKDLGEMSREEASQWLHKNSLI